jgi:hypothetical protein
MQLLALYKVFENKKLLNIKIEKHNMRISKRGQVSDQFNWLFVVIAGGVILLFFFFVIVQIQAAGEAKLHAVVLGNMDAILTGSQVSPNTLNRIESSETLRFDISCDDFGSVMSVPKTQSQVDISRKIVFAPGIIGSNQIYVYVKPIEKPMYVDNVIYLTDTRTFFLVMGGNSTSNLQLNSLYLQIPDGIPKAGGPIIEDRLRAYNTIVIVNASGPLDTLTWNHFGEGILRRKNANWITVNASGVYMATKTDRQSEFGTSELVGIADQAFQVMFSKNKKFFECTQGKINERTKVVAKVYERRSEQLAARYISGNPCQFQLNLAKDRFGDIVNKITNDQNYTAEITNLRNINNELILLTCPTAY